MECILTNFVNYFIIIVYKFLETTLNRFYYSFI